MREQRLPLMTAAKGKGWKGGARPPPSACCFDWVGGGTGVICVWWKQREDLQRVEGINACSLLGISFLGLVLGLSTLGPSSLHARVVCL